MNKKTLSRGEKIGALIFRYNFGHLTAVEQQELKSWREESPRNEELFQLETDIPRVIQEVNEIIDSREIIWQKLVERMPELAEAREKPVVNRPWLRVAASITTVAVMGAYFYQNWKSNLVEPGGYEAGLVTKSTGIQIIDDMVRGYNTGRMGIKFIWKPNGEKIAIVPNHPGYGEDPCCELYTPAGKMMPFFMPTGAKIWLNASSIIQFPSDFNFPMEQFSISGNALVEIPNDRNRMNVIQTAKSRIETTGARFGIHAYPRDSSIRLSVLEGSTKFIKDVEAKNTEPIPVLAGQELIYEKGIVSISPIGDTLELTGWTNGRTYYKNASLVPMLQDLARWYNVQLVFQGKPSVQKYNLDLPRDAEFKEVMEALQKQGVHLFLMGRRVEVFSK